MFLGKHEVESMPSSNSDDAQMVSVRLPRALIQRLDRYLDWWNLNRQAKFSRNAAIRQALDSWLDDQEQCAGFLEPQFQRQQFQNAYHSLSKRHEWVAIHHLRPTDAMVPRALRRHGRNPARRSSS
jgi:hypothetical protein